MPRGVSERFASLGGGGKEVAEEVKTQIGVVLNITVDFYDNGPFGSHAGQAFGAILKKPNIAIKKERR